MKRQKHLRYRSGNRGGPVANGANPTEEDAANKRDAEALARFFRAVLNKEPDPMPTNPERAFAEGLRRLVAAHPYLQLDVDWETGIAILACLQLSLRHPGNAGASSKRVRGFCDRIISLIEKVDPQLAEVLRMGDNPEHDVGTTG